MKTGIYTFARAGIHPITKEVITPHQRLLNLIEETELADQPAPGVFAVLQNQILRR